jgi:hypothetical protein
MGPIGPHRQFVDMVLNRSRSGGAELLNSGVGHSAISLTVKNTDGKFTGSLTNLLHPMATSK